MGSLDEQLTRAIGPMTACDPSRNLTPWAASLAFDIVIILARHGRTSFNDEGRYQGSHDSPLTSLGLKQSHKLGILIGAISSGKVTLWSSPLGRALHTARIIKDVAGLDGKIVIDQRLREVSLGSWDGLTDEEIESASPGSCNGATRFDWFFRAPDGESFELVEARLTGWLADVHERPGCHIAVSHGLSGRILRGVYTAMPKDEALKLDVSQDAVFRLQDGRCEHIAFPS